MLSYLLAQKLLFWNLMVSKEDELFTQFLSTEDIILTPYWGLYYCPLSYASKSLISCIKTTYLSEAALLLRLATLLASATAASCLLLLAAESWRFLDVAWRSNSRARYSSRGALLDNESEQNFKNHKNIIMFVNCLNTMLYMIF